MMTFLAAAASTLTYPVQQIADHSVFTIAAAVVAALVVNARLRSRGGRRMLA